MVYPGVGWVLWRTKEDLPEELVFKVAYLGQEQARRAPWPRSARVMFRIRSVSCPSPARDYRSPGLTRVLFTQTTFNLNFSMNAAPIACQYYNFIRLGCVCGC